jgi:hypothetical protein
MTRDNVDDIVASVEDAVRRAYALGRADAMKRVVELAQSDDPGLRAIALLGPAEPARATPPPALLDAPQSSPAQPPEHQPVEAHEQAADAADGRHEARQDAAAAAAEPSPAPQPAMAGQPEREPPASVGEFLADFFYPIGSKKR